MPGRRNAPKKRSTTKKSAKKIAKRTASAVKSAAKNPKRTAKRAATKVHRGASRARSLAEDIITAGEALKKGADVVDEVAQRMSQRKRGKA